MGGAGDEARGCSGAVDISRESVFHTNTMDMSVRSTALAHLEPGAALALDLERHEYATALAHLEPDAALALDLERRANSRARRRDATHTHAIADPATHARARRDVFLSYLHI